MKRRGMEAVASKSARRTPVFLRKKKGDGMSDAPMPPKPKSEQDDEDMPLTCPKCGMQLADTEENRAYAKMRADEMEDEESEDESEEEGED